MLMLSACETVSQAQNQNIKPVGVSGGTSGFTTTNVEIGPPDVEPIDASCFPSVQDTPNAVIANAGAVLVGLNRAGQIEAYYPTSRFQAQLDNVTTHEELYDLVNRARLRRNFKRYTLRDRRARVGASGASSPLDFDTDRNSVTAIRLLPANWEFREAGFWLAKGQAGGAALAPGQIPFTVTTPAVAGLAKGSKKTILVAFDRNSQTPEAQCTYKYELPITVWGPNAKEGSFKTNIIIDPDWGNKGGPPPHGG